MQFRKQKIKPLPPPAEQSYSAVNLYPVNEPALNALSCHRPFRQIAADKTVTNSSRRVNHTAYTRIYTAKDTDPALDRPENAYSKPLT